MSYYEQCKQPCLPPPICVQKCNQCVEPCKTVCVEPCSNICVKPCSTQCVEVCAPKCVEVCPAPCASECTTCCTTQCVEPCSTQTSSFRFLLKSWCGCRGFVSKMQCCEQREHALKR
uniref:Uncharacterized protein n=1 Tax=Anser cygnoides TaxID=8845 RepID=A0A8B9DMP9_ANSCY